MVTGLDVLQAVSATLQITTELIKLIRAYKNAPAGIKSLAIRLEDDVSLLTELKTILVQSSVGNNQAEESHAHIRKLLIYIDPLLRETKIKIERLMHSSTSITAKGRWIIVGGDLDKAEKELFEWSQRLSLRLTLLPHQTKADLSEHASQSAFGALRAQVRMEDIYKRFRSLPTPSSDNKAELPRTSLPSDCSTSTRSTITITANSGSQEVILEPNQIPELPADDENAMSWEEHELRSLTTLLHAVSPKEMHILQAHNFVSLALNPSNRLLGLLYQIPKGFSSTYHYSTSSVSPQSFPTSPPATLHSLLSATSKSGSRLIAQHALSQRFELARQIATAVFYCHSIGWVHKSITSRNIVMLSRTSNPPSSSIVLPFPRTLGTAFLAGFGYSRRESDRSTGPAHLIDEVEESERWKHQIYQHPDRVTESGRSIIPHSRYRFHHDLYSLGVVLLEIARWRAMDASGDVLKDKNYDERRAEMIAMADRAAVVVGERYARVVKRCLEGWDDENGRRVTLGSEVAYVVGELEELSVAMS